MRKPVYALALLAGGTGTAFSQTAPPSSAWEFNTPADLPICQIDGVTPQGHVVLRAAANAPDVVRLVLTKRTWRIPNGTDITALITFSEESVLRLAGRGENTSIVFDLTAATLKPWLHGFTAGNTGTITFAEGNEAPWAMDLRGTTRVVNALYECVQANSLRVPAPLGTPPTQPFAAGTAPPSIARPDTQPGGRPGEPAGRDGLSETFKVWLEADVSGSLRPMVLGRTNLPSGTKLQVSLKPAYPGCTPNCAYAWPDTTVLDGKFEMGPFGGKPGSYTIIVSTFMNSFSATGVQTLLGKRGEKMTGDAVRIGPMQDPIVLTPGERGVYYTKDVVVPSFGH